MGRETRPPGRQRPGGLNYAFFIAGFLLFILPVIESQDDTRDSARISPVKYERAARSVPQVGLLASTARTFVLDGASTEYATQVLGTTLDNGLYTQILASSSRVFYDKDSITPESASPYLVYPSKFDQDKWRVFSGVVDESPEIHKKITSSSSTSTSSSSSSSGNSNDQPDRENDIFEVRRDFNNESPQKFKPSKPRINLPTYTVKQELTGGFGSAIYDNEEADSVRNYRPRVPKIYKPQASRLIQKKEPSKPLATVTYHGFADFTTTVGDTIIIFSPSTAPPPMGRAATTIKGDATLRPDDGNAISIQPTNVVTGREKTSDPLLDAINRRPEKENLRPSIQQEEEESSSTKQTPILLVPTEEMKPTGLLKVLDSTTSHDGTTTHYKSSIFGTYIGTNYAQIIHTSSNVYFFPDEATATVDGYVTGKPESETESPSEDTPTTFGAVDTTTPMPTTDETVVPEDSELTTVSEETTEAINSITTFKAETTTQMDPEIPNDILDPQGRSVKGNSKNRLSDDEKSNDFSPRLRPSEVYKTFTYYTTFFIPDETNKDVTTTSIRSREVVSSEVTYLTEYSQSSAASDLSTVTSTKVAEPTTPSVPPQPVEEEVEDEDPTTKREEIELIFKTLYTTYTYLTTFFQESTSSVSSREVVETNVVTQTVGPGGISGDVVGLFTDDVIITPTKVQEIPLSSSVVETTDDTDEFPTTLEDTTTESSFTTPKDFVDQPIDSVSQLEPSPVSTLVPETMKAETKTYFTTYTYFTTIFVDDETEIETRTEVFSNIVTEPFEPTAVAPPPEKSSVTPEPPKSQPAPPPEILAYLEALQKQKSQEEALKLAKRVQQSVHSLPTTTEFEESTTLEAITGEEAEDVTEKSWEDGEVLGSMITDVVSSSSSSDGPLLEPSMDKRHAGLDAEDQELSESNHHDVEPAPTLLLRTSYTTFTYFTTMYKGDASNIASRLQTVTNIVTETIRPTPAMDMDGVPTTTLPVTYFTTFTYWTTYYKGGDTITTSREETVSNVVTPGVSPTPTVQLGVIMTYRPDSASEEDLVTTKVIADNEVMQNDKTTGDKGIIYAVSASDTTTPEAIEPSTINPDPTTYYTTFTYFTTSYIGNETILNSRLETITSVAYSDEVLKATGRAIGTPVSNIQDLETEEKTRSVKVEPTKTADEPKTGLISTIRSRDVADGTTTHYLTDIYGTYIDGLYAQVVQSTTSLEAISKSSTTAAPIIPTPSFTPTPALPTGVLSLNKGSIIDADEVTTVYFATNQIGTLIDGLYAKVIESTSSTKIDAERKLTLRPTEERHRTGLVRLIKGQIESNGSTIVYQSKVIGTSIEGRYAQIIESTSSYLLGATSRISPTATQLPAVTKSPEVLSPTPAVIQSSIPDNTNNNEDEREEESEEQNEEDNEENQDEDEEDDGKSKKKSRLTFQSRKRTFTPVIRPFLSRSRPTFNPKRKGAQAATTITRTDITPTITATLAGSKGNRFASSRARVTPSASAASSSINPSRRFSGRRSSSNLSQASSAISPSSRGRQSPRISPSPTYSVNRRGPSSIRGSSARPLVRGSSSSLYAGSSSRFRGGIRPSSTLFRSSQPVNPTQLAKNDDQEDEANEFTATTLPTEETPLSTSYDEFGEIITTLPVKTTTESSRRSTNPLLRFRRPFNVGSNQVSRGTPPRRTTTTTSRPSTVAQRSGARSLNSPTLPPFTRSRGSNRLFPPRTLINQPTTETENEEYETTEETDTTKSFDDERAVEEIVDNDYEGSENNKRRRIATTTPPTTTPRLAYGNRFIAQRRRFKRQVSQLRSYQNNRYRRPGTLALSAEDRLDDDSPSSHEEPQKTTARSPYSARGRTSSSVRPSTKTTPEKYSSSETSGEIPKSRRRPTSPRVKPTPTSSSGRQFTLRDSNGYKRTSSSGKENLRRTSPSSRVRSSTRRTDTSYDSRRSTSRPSVRTRNTSRRPTQRGRVPKEDYSYNDGTITVTHYVPTEVTIPVVNNGATEQRNIITASPSVEVLGPDRYTTVTGGDGRPLVVIATESSGVNGNGQTEVTRFLLHTTPTSRVSHTLTTVGGRRVSQSLIVPSTIYSVENVVSTIPASLPTGNAPLANILLSQLLLGQLGGANGLLGGATAAQVDATPTTSFNTRTTSYVTTITKERSTVIPLTFRGKEILTTLVESSTNVITATEYITDTVVVTPTVAIPAANLNSLLLLLQQQPQASQYLQQSQLHDPLFAAAPIFTQSNSLPGELERRHQPADLDYRPDDESLTSEEYEKLIKPKAKLQKKESPAETSIVTLYVSGKRPGEFSTILSTVKIGEESTASSRKRRDLVTEVQPSIPPSLLTNSDTGLSRLSPSEESINVHSPTQSLESVVGDVGRHISTSIHEAIDDSFFGQKYAIDDEQDADGDNYPGVRRKIVRIPVIKQTERQHKYTVVRRRPLVPYTKQFTIPEETTSSTPRRIVVTRVRSHARSRHFSDYDETPVIDSSPSKRHKVTITRRRKVQPTPVISVAPTTVPRRHVRKKLVQVRPIITTTPTFAIITTGFYGIPNTNDEDDDYEEEEVADPEIPGSEYESHSVDDIRELGKLPESNTNTEMIDELVGSDGSEILSTPTSEATPVIITDHFFFPSSDDDEEESTEEDKLEETTEGNVDEHSPEGITSGGDEQTVTEPVIIDTSEETSEIPEEPSTIPNIEEVSEEPVVIPEQETVDEEGKALDVTMEGADEHSGGLLPNFDDQEEERKEEDHAEEEKKEDREEDERIEHRKEDVRIEDREEDERIEHREDDERIEDREEDERKEDREEDERIEHRKEDERIEDREEDERIEHREDDERIEDREEDERKEDREEDEKQQEVGEGQAEGRTEPKEEVEGKEEQQNREEEEAEEEATVMIDTIQPSTTEQYSEVLTVVPIEFSLKISPTLSNNDAAIPSVIPLESFVSSSEIIMPTATIKTNNLLSNTTVISASPTPEEIEAGLTDELYLSLSHFNLPNLSILNESKVIDDNPKDILPTPTVIFTETVVTSTRLRTYTYVVTKLNGLETQVTSSTTVRPRVTTLTLTVPITIIPSTNSVDSMSSSIMSISTDHQQIGNNENVEQKIHDDSENQNDELSEDEGRRLNLATRIMSNGVEVIVAGPTPALRWENSNPQPTFTLSDAVMMMMPQEDPNEFVTKTCTTTFTYLNTITKDGTTIVSTDQQVVANTATEERHRKPGTESAAVTLEASPTLRTEVFKTTYTYLTLNADHPNADDALGSSQKVIANTVTAPQHYLDMILEPSESHPPPLTNTYLSTRILEKTFVEEGLTKIETMSDTITRLIITESAPPPPRPTSVTTTLTALDNPDNSMTDIMKTYYITYTYHNTYLEKGSTVVRTNIATSTDVTVEKVPKKTSITPEPMVPLTSTPDPIKIFATKTYLTTFTYFTTLLQAGADGETSTTISSRSHVVENVVTESIAPSLLNSGYMNLLTTAHRSDPVQNVVTGSTIIFFDDDDQIYASPTTTNQIQPSAAMEIPSDMVNDGPSHSDQVENGDNGDNGNDNDQLEEGNMEDAEASASEHQEEIQINEGLTSQDGSSERPVSTGLLSLGSLGINGLSALGPVITAMAGLLQGKPSSSSNNRRNDTVYHSASTPSPPAASLSPNSGSHLTNPLTTQRSPIYIPVAEFADGDIEAAESQNIVTQLTNPNFIPETRHKVAASLVDGIPISPGEIITANSDVIIGKPGKLAPRPPLTYENEGTEVGGLKPPPISVPNIPVHPVLEVVNEEEGIPQHSVPQKKISDMLNKVPVRTSSKHDILENDPLLRPPGRPNIEKYANPNINPKEPQWLADNFKRPWSAKDPLLPPPPPPTQPAMPSRIDDNSHHYHHQEETKHPLWAQKDPIASSEPVDIQSPELSEPPEPIIHQVPHVIDRSTGQPLLVNIQPSQVANVVIPQGGTQALIFGDTNEPHISGQYFDDPSPYPEPEVGPSFDKFEADPSQYMLPPPSPNFNAPQNYPHSQTSNSDVHGHHYDIPRPEKTPSDIRLIQRPDIHGQSQGHVHTEILVHHSPDTANLHIRPQSNQQSIYPELSPPPPPRVDYYKPPVNIEHMPPRRSEVPSMDHSSNHNFHRYGYHNRDKPSNKTLMNEILKQKWKNDRYKTRFQMRPRPSIIRPRPSYPPHPGKMKFAPSGRPTLVPPAPKYPPQIPIDNRYKDDNKEAQDNLPTGAVSYQNPLRTHISQHEQPHTQQSQEIPLSPEMNIPQIQSFGQILPPTNEPETWSDTQTEKSMDSEAEESEETPINHNEPQVHQEQDQDREHEQEQSSPPPVISLPEEAPMSPEYEETSSDGDNQNTGTRVELQPTDVYDYDVQISQESSDNSPQNHEETYNNSPSEEPIENGTRDYEVVEGESFSYSNPKQDEYDNDETMDLKPPEPQRPTSQPDQFNESFGSITNPPGGHARPPINWSGDTNDYPQFGNRKNSTIPNTYFYNSQSNSNKHYINTDIIRNPGQSINSAARPHPSYPYIITKPQTSLPVPVIISSDSNSKYPFTDHSNVEGNTKNNKNYSKDIHRLDTRPVITMQPVNSINRDKSTETLEGAYQTNFASNDENENKKTDLEKSKHRIESKVPSTAMVPPPQMKPLPNIKDMKHNEDSDLKPPPAVEPTVVGMSPPPRQPPKYIPLKDTNKVVGETPPPPPPPPPPPQPSRPSFTMIPPTYPRPTKSRPYLVQLLSQDMVPPPIIESSRPIEIATVRPAIAVSGSMQIGTAVATSHIPVMQDIESTIPIVHGTVDLPVIMDVSDILKTITETRKPELISIYTVRPFETRQVSRVSVQPTQIISSNLIVPTRIRTSSQVHKSQTKRIDPSSTRSQVYITKSPSFGHRKSVIIEGSRHSHQYSRISPTPTKSLNHYSNFVFPSENSTSSLKNIHFTTLRKPSASLASSITEMKPKAVTHYKTLTVTRTETSVVGSPPTTRTLLLTHTLTSTIVETVTETLLRPTSVVATVTSITTILQSVAQSTASIYDTYNSPDNMDSIFVVMSGQNPPAPGAEEVEAEYGGEEEVSRDEQDPAGNEIHRVLAGGIFGAVVPAVSHGVQQHECRPECRASKSETCARVGGEFRCVCRPGFARMFPDRPCKPTYTYTLKLGLDRIGKESIDYERMSLNNTSSSGFKRLMSSARDALDRTLMQTDLRDIYRGLNISKFHKSETAEVEFHVQLSDNASEAKLKETIKKYLVSSNYSLGGTHVYASPNFARIEAKDFDECSTEEGGPHHDCSPHAACFNLRGSYQCSCKEGWADLSENPAYPGRLCSQAPLGCRRCHNKGHCLTNSYGQDICECFPWHSGQHCQINLKVLLIALVTTGAVLVGLLGVCLALVCFRGTPRLNGHKLKSGRISGDKRAMIASGNCGDTSSEGSLTDLAIPHHVPHVLPPPPRSTAPIPPIPPAPPKETHQLSKNRGKQYTRHNQKKYIGSSGDAGKCEDNQRGLSVMIPRAKYRSGPQSGHYSKQPITSFSADEHKLISYLEGSNRKPSLASTNKEYVKSIREYEESTLRVVRNPPNNGALVSAGFQVSATVTKTADDDSTLDDTTLDPSTLKTLRSTTDYQDGASTLARSCDATTIQATTKLMRMDLAEDGDNSVKQASNSRDSKDTRDARDSASEGPITAERDLGSTLRLRHTPLYNTDRAVSDRDSNFDSL